MFSRPESRIIEDKRKPFKSCLFCITNIRQFSAQIGDGPGQVSEQQLQLMSTALTELEQVGYTFGFRFEDLPEKPILQLRTEWFINALKRDELCQSRQIHPKNDFFRHSFFIVHTPYQSIHNLKQLVEAVIFERQENAPRNGFIDKKPEHLANPALKERSVAIIKTMQQEGQFPKSYEKKWNTRLGFWKNVYTLFHDYHRKSSKIKHPKRGNRRAAKEICHLIAYKNVQDTGRIMNLLRFHSAQVHTPPDHENKINEAGSFSHRLHFALMKGWGL